MFIEALPFKYHVEKVESLLNDGVKVVAFGNVGIDRNLISLIETDYFQVMSTAVEYLKSLGHQNIAYVSGLAKRHSLDTRIDGFRAAMKKLLNNPAPLVIEPTKNSLTDIEDGYRLTHRLIKSGKTFSAVITTNDIMAIGAMDALRMTGYKIPEDVSVVGIDDAAIGEICCPKLTTIGFNQYDIGCRAFRMLYDDMQSDTKGFFQNKYQLIVRDSTGPAHT